MPSNAQPQPENPVEPAAPLISRRRLIQLGIWGLIGVSTGVVRQLLRAPLANTLPSAQIITSQLPEVIQPQPSPLASPTVVASPLPSPTPFRATPTATPSAIPQTTAQPAVPTTAQPVASTATPPPTVVDAQPATAPTTTISAARVRVAQPPVISRADWGAAKPSRPYVPQQPRWITLHHEGVLFDGSTSAPEYLRRVQHWSITNRRWPDIPYHFLLDLEGNTYEARPLTARGDTNTFYDLQDHALIALLGKYDAGEQQPSRAQIAAVIALMAWIASTYAIGLDRIHGHRDYIPLNRRGEHIDPQTGEKITCPGDNVYRYLADRTIQNGVARSLGDAPIRKSGAQLPSQ